MKKHSKNELKDDNVSFSWFKLFFYSSIKLKFHTQDIRPLTNTWTLSLNNLLLSKGKTAVREAES